MSSLIGWLFPGLAVEAAAVRSVQPWDSRGPCRSEGLTSPGPGGSASHRVLVDGDGPHRETEAFGP